MKVEPSDEQPGLGQDEYNLLLRNSAEDLQRYLFNMEYAEYLVQAESAFDQAVKELAYQQNLVDEMNRVQHKRTREDAEDSFMELDEAVGAIQNLFRLRRNQETFEADTDEDVRQMPAKRSKKNSSAVIGNGVELRPSQIPNAGVGLFATRNFERNELITEYEGEQIDWKEAQRRRDQGRDSHIKSLAYGYVAIDGLKDPSTATGFGGGSFANDPYKSEFTDNAKFVIKEDKKQGRDRIWLQALHYIDAGEEIFVDYEDPSYFVRLEERQRLARPSSPIQQEHEKPSTSSQSSISADMAKSFIEFATKHNLKFTSEESRREVWDIFKDANLNVGEYAAVIPYLPIEEFEIARQEKNFATLRKSEQRIQKKRDKAERQADTALARIRSLEEADERKQDRLLMRGIRQTDSQIQREEREVQRGQRAIENQLRREVSHQDEEIEE